MHSKLLVCWKNFRRTNPLRPKASCCKPCNSPSSSATSRVPRSLHGGCLESGRYKPTIKGSCCETFQMFAPTGTVKTKSQILCNSFRHNIVIKRGISTRCVCLGRLWTAFASCSMAASAAAGGGVHTHQSEVCPLLYQSSGVNHTAPSRPLNQPSTHSLTSNGWRSSTPKCRGI